MYRRPASGTLAAPRKRRYHLDTTYGGPASGTFSAVGVVSAVTAPRSGAIALTRRIAVRRARILDFQIYVTPFPAVSPLPRIRASYSQLNVWSSAERRLRAVHKFNFFSTARPSSPPPPTPSLKMKIRFLRVRRATLPAPLPKFFFPLRGPFSSSTPTPCFGNLKIRVPASDVSSSMVLSLGFFQLDLRFKTSYFFVRRTTSQESSQRSKIAYCRPEPERIYCTTGNRGSRPPPVNTPVQRTGKYAE
ncbi:hypothetical protein R3P38DRAFT_2795715 [Favolaschia claudopus]|uniref:Uncharacterized protein n=1 Tax=Favolaschia claudopus TaxID=2862362 RepID=A0AAW0A745_9AGAR